MGVGNFLQKEKGVMDGKRVIYNSRGLGETHFSPGAKKDT